MNLKRTALLSLSALLMIIGSACVSDDPPVEVTVMTARISGTFIEEDGCLRVTGPSGTGGDAIVWQKEVLEIERRGDAVDIFKPNGTRITTWRLGDKIRGGGGSISRRIVDEHAGAGFSERCEGPYFLLGLVDDPVG